MEINLLIGLHRECLVCGLIYISVSSQICLVNVMITAISFHDRLLRVGRSSAANDGEHKRKENLGLI